MPLVRSKGITRRGFMRRTRRPLRDWRQKHPRGTRKRLIEDLDEACSLIVRRRDRRCVCCNERDWQKLTAGHFYSRRFYGTRWQLDNLHCQCRRCNELHNSNVWPFTNYMIEVVGTERLSELFTLRNSTRHISTVELEELLDELRLMQRKMC